MSIFTVTPNQLKARAVPSKKDVRITWTVYAFEATATHTRMIARTAIGQFP